MKKTYSYLISTRWGVKFTPGGHSSFFGFVNTFVHIIMYAYYMLAAMGPHMQKYLWWKKYLTLLVRIKLFFRFFLNLIFPSLPANGSIRSCDDSRFSTHLPQSMQLSDGFRVLDRSSCHHVLLAVQQFL